MTIKTNCEVCKKVIRYTNDNQQVQEAIDNPDQFCEGHIAEPNSEALKAIMAILRAHANPNNRFFIAKSDGHLISSAYLDSSNGSYFPSIPKGSYEVGAGKKQSRSYAILKEHFHLTWIEKAKEESMGVA
jgi:hypothetical protein